MDYLKLTNDVLDVGKISSEVSDPGCGAVSLFVGTTRDNFDGKKVERLEYESYNEMAEKEMKKLCSKAREKWDLKNIAIYHRLGLVPVQEASVVIAVSSEHRRESLDAVSFMIDALKASVPIWKREVYDDGSGDWKKNKECKWTEKKRKHDMEEDEEECAKKIKIDGEEAPNEQICEEASLKKDVNEIPPEVDRRVVQITASNEEIKRRITAFQQRKREELDVTNVQEFCFYNGVNNSASCARTTAILVRSKGSNSHLKLTKVVNEWGPQTLGVDPGSINSNPVQPKMEPSIESEIKEEKDTQIAEGVEERLQNMETHLQIKPNGPLPKDIYARIKALEGRILFLEGLSPEYFNCKVPQYVKRFVKPDIKINEDDMKLEDLDARIFELKEKLKNKQLKLYS
ncbi:molybdenum cofactor synthesis 2B [Oratosquilla oratoria]|uniref:molybdenum cofactor synthesis 2B n=1 Tax=Oratosquilla oratoria TaxID=337810 RepID=UPI003F76819F